MCFSEKPRMEFHLIVVLYDIRHPLPFLPCVFPTGGGVGGGKMIHRQKTMQHSLSHHMCMGSYICVVPICLSMHIHTHTHTHTHTLIPFRISVKTRIRFGLPYALKIHIHPYTYPPKTIPRLLINYTLCT